MIIKEKWPVYCAAAAGFFTLILNILYLVSYFGIVFLRSRVILLVLFLPVLMLSVFAMMGIVRIILDTVFFHFLSILALIDACWIIVSILGGAIFYWPWLVKIMGEDVLFSDAFWIMFIGFFFIIGVIMIGALIKREWLLVLSMLVIVLAFLATQRYGGLPGTHWLIVLFSGLSPVAWGFIVWWLNTDSKTHDTLDGMEGK